MADTLKAQFTAFLTTGRVLFSDMGRVLASIVDDTCGWHDTLSGCGNAAALAAQVRRRQLPEAAQRLLPQRARQLPRRALASTGSASATSSPTSISSWRWWSTTPGSMAWRAGNSRPGAHVDLRFEMDTLVVLTNTPHPLDPEPRYAPPGCRARRSPRRSCGARRSVPALASRKRAWFRPHRGLP